MGRPGPGPEGTVLTISFELDSEEFTAINGGPHFTFSPAISFVVKCGTQDEVDYYWEKLSSGGRPDQRMAYRQVRRFLADRSHRADRAVKRSGRCEIATGYESNASDGQNRY